MPVLTCLLCFLHDSDHGDDACISHALPRQTQYQCIQLGAAQRPSICPASRWPDKAALVQPACCQPDADTVMHQNFDAVASCIGKEVGGMRVGCTKHRYNAGQCCVGSTAHVHGGGCKPDGVDTDHLSTSRIQAAQSVAQTTGHWIRMMVSARCSSI